MMIQTGTMTTANAQIQSRKRRKRIQIVGIAVTMKTKVIHLRQIEQEPCQTLVRSLGAQKEEYCRMMYLIMEGHQKDDGLLSKVTMMKQR